MEEYERPIVTDATCFSCGQHATHHYFWPWGERGYSCMGCIPQLRATATRLKRPVEIESLFPTPEALGAPPSPSEEANQLRKTVLELSTVVEEHERRNAQLCQELARAEERIAELQAAHSVIEGGAQNT
jgi:hypothetical protein